VKNRAGMPKQHAPRIADCSAWNCEVPGLSSGLVEGSLPQGGHR
jgi:hypothetical protein